MQNIKKHWKVLLVSLLLVINTNISALYAQIFQKKCISSYDIEKIRLYDPERYQEILKIQAQRTRYNQTIQTREVNDPAATIIIPVVVHVIHFGESIGTGRNISDAQIRSQIAVLNEDYRRLNTNRTATPTAFQSVAGDARIEFRLACLDPNGATTSGITRTRTSRTLPFPPPENSRDGVGAIIDRSVGIKFSSSGGRDAWATNNYLNIWVTDFQGELAGYATSPDQYKKNPNTDGVVIRYDLFGKTGNLKTGFSGRVATHEIGHYLDVLHIAQEFQCKDDGVSDTPLQQTQNGGCPTFPKKNCANTANGEMFMNFMDNTNDACQNLFTKGQINLMRASFFSTGVRSRFFYRADGNGAFCQNSTAVFSTPNPLCLAVTWQVSGPIAIRSGQNTNSLTVAGTGVGTATITMRAGTYVDTRQI